MILQLTPGNITNRAEFTELIQMIESQDSNTNNLDVNLENTNKINLAQFNTLVSLYVKLKRSGIKLTYKNFGQSVKNFVDKTNFHHVFQA